MASAISPAPRGGAVERFDIQNETWLSPISLEGAPGAPTVVAADDDGIYAAYNSAVYRYRTDGTSPLHLINLSSTQAIHTDGNLLFVNHTSGLYARFTSINKSTNSIIATFDNYVHAAIGSSIAREMNKIFGRSQGISPSDITFVSYSDSGQFTLGGDSPYHGAYPGGSQTWVFPGGTKVVDNSGTVYATDNLTRLTSFGATLSDIDFRGSDVPVVLSGSVVTAYTPGILPAGSATLAYAPAKIFVNDANVWTFTADAASPTGYLARSLPLSSLAAPVPNQPLDPVGLPYTPDKIELAADGTLLLLSKAHQSVFRWDPTTQLYGATIPLVGTPNYMAYSATNNTIYLAYQSGLIRKIDLNAAQLQEVPFATLATAPYGLSTAGTYVFAGDGSGAWMSHYTFDSSGRQIDVEDWNYYSTEYIWSDANQKMYFFRDDSSPNDLLWEEINANGTTYPNEPPGGIGIQRDSPLHGDVPFIHPIRVAPDGSIVVIGSGRIFDARTLALLPDSLAYAISDATWLGSQLYTVRNISGAAQFQHWVQPTFAPGALLQRTVTARALLAIGPERMVAVFDTPVPTFTVLDANLNEYQLNQPPSEIVFSNVLGALAENTSTAAPIKVADVTVVDEPRGYNALSLSGADAAKFELVGSALRLKAGTALNFENRSTLTVNVNANDPTVGGSPDLTVVFELALTDVNEAPTAITLQNAVTSIVENTDTTAALVLGTIAVTDDALGTNTFTLAGVDAASFELTGSQLTLRAGTTLDYETKRYYDVTIRVDDDTIGNTPDASYNYRLSVGNINEPPSGLALLNQVSSLREDANTTTAIKLADISYRDDSSGSNQLTLSGPDAAVFQVSGSTLRLRAGTVLDFETKSSYQIDVNLDDASVGTTPDASVPFVLNITELNEAPRAVRLENVVQSLVETADTSAPIKLADIFIDDDEAGTNELSLSGLDAALLEIVGNELRLRAGAILSAASNPVLTAVVQADDLAVGGTPDAATVVSVNVLPDGQNDPPLVALVDRIAEISEATDLQNGMKVARIVIWDDGLGVNQLSLGGADESAFEISANELRLRPNMVLDYAAQPSYSVTVHVDDPSVGTTPDASVYFTIQVIEVLGQPAATVAGRYVFYNNAAFDGNDPTANFSDDAAIAPDKSALLPGQTAAFANYTSYSKGLNGVIVDLANRSPAELGFSDFQFRVGNSDAPTAWAAAPEPAVIDVRRGAGIGGADRVTLTWPDGAIKKQWLEVTILANVATGLVLPDVFYFGNAVAEAGNSTANAVVSAVDELLARANPRTPLSPAAVDFRFDYNRDGLVNAADQVIARANQTTPLTALRLFAPAAVAEAELSALGEAAAGALNPPVRRRRA